MGEVQRWSPNRAKLTGNPCMQRNEVGEWVRFGDFAALTAKYEAERAAREADAADAARWRYVRVRELTISRHSLVKSDQSTELDAAIDAAMKGSQP